MNNEQVKTHLKKVLDKYMRPSTQDKESLLLQDSFINENKEVYRLVGIIR